MGVLPNWRMNPRVWVGLGMKNRNRCTEIHWKSKLVRNCCVAAVVVVVVVVAAVVV